MAERTRVNAHISPHITKLLVPCRLSHHPLLPLRELMGPVNPGKQFRIDFLVRREQDMVGPSARIRLALHGDPGRIDRFRQAQGQRDEMPGHLRFSPYTGERHATKHQPVEKGDLRFRHPDFHLRIPPHQLLLQGLIQSPCRRIPGKERFFRGNGY